MADLLSPGSAGLGQYRVNPATGEVRFAPGGAEGWPVGVTETRLTAAVRDAAGAWAFARVTVDVTRPASEDADAAAYLDAVEIADGAALEAGVRAAVDTLVKGMKADGLWSAIDYIGLRAGPRTLAGLALNLKGASATLYNFVSGDISRTDGLNGNGSSKYVDSGFNASGAAQNDASFGVYFIGAVYVGGGRYISAHTQNIIVGTAGTTGFRARSASSTVNELGTGAATAGTLGVSRGGSGSYSWIGRGQSGTQTQASESTVNGRVFEFCGNDQGLNVPADYLPSGQRIVAAWWGSALNLSALDSRLAAYRAALVAALP